MAGKVIRRSFGGGFRFRNYIGQPAGTLDSLTIPERVVIPMLQGFGVALKPLVEPGQTVATSQIIGRDDATPSSPVHATVNGKVTAITQIEYVGRNVPAVVIAGDGTDSWVRLEGHSTQHQRLTPEQIEELLYQSGVSGLGSEGIPTRFHTSVISPADVRHLIVHLTGSDVFNPAPDVWFAGRNRDAFIGGIEILQRVMPKAGIHIVLSRHEPVLLESIGKLTAGMPAVKLYAVDSKYPQAAPEMLVTTILGEEFPYGHAAANIGVVVLDAQAVLHAYEAVVEGKPVIERLVALSGPGFLKPGHVRVRVGTPIERITAGRLKDSGDVRQRVVLDSLLSGTGVADLSLPLDRTVNQLIALPDDDRRLPFAFARPGLHTDSFSRSFVPAWLPTGKAAGTNRHGEERPCIQCGWCARVCPVRIIPHLIYRQARVGINELLVRYGVFNCIDCNLCSFVCPSKIALARHVREAKEKLLEVGCDNSSCILPRFDLKGIEQYKGVKSVR